MDANIVFSAGKTASTSLFKSWAKVSLPVFHTHDMKWFCVVDKIDSVYMNYLLSKGIEEHLYSPMLPEYLPSGHVDVRFCLKGDFTLSKVFPSSIFKTKKIIGIVREPMKRRVSSMLNDLTIEGVNAYCDANKLGMNINENDDLLKQVQKVHTLCNEKTHYKLLTELAFKEGRLWGKNEILNHFKSMYYQNLSDEYILYYSQVKENTGISIEPDLLKNNGFFESEKGDFKILVFKFEKISQMANKLQEFTGIVKLNHDRKTSDYKTILDEDVDIKDIIDNLINKYSNSLYIEGSKEQILIKQMGY